MISSIYNHYMTTYNPPSVSRKNLHKRSELKSIYNRIVSINRQSPLFKVNLSDNVQICALDIKESAIALNSFSDSFHSSKKDTSFNKKIATTSNNDVVNANIITNNHDDLPEGFSIKVNSLATSQVNESRDSLAEFSGAPKGTYTFAVNINNKSHEFEFNIDEQNSNKEILTKLGRLINKSSIGIKASIEKGSKADTVKMILKSDATGTDDGSLIFTLHDINFTGDAKRGIVDFYSLNEVKVHPDNSSFDINGEEYQSNENVFIYDNSLEISMNKVTSDEVYVGYKPDTTDILDTLDQFIVTFNNLVSTSRKHSDEQRSSTKLVNDLTDITMDHINELSSAGFVVESDGTLSADESLSVQSAEDGTLKDFFYSESGFMNGISQKTRKVLLNPMDYVDKLIVTYPNPYSRNYPNPYITSMYSGMLFNYYC